MLNHFSKVKLCTSLCHNVVGFKFKYKTINSDILTVTEHISVHIGLSSKAIKHSLINTAN